MILYTHQVIPACTGMMIVLCVPRIVSYCTHGKGLV